MLRGPLQHCARFKLRPCQPFIQYRSPTPIRQSFICRSSVVVQVQSVHMVDLTGGNPDGTRFPLAVAHIPMGPVPTHAPTHLGPLRIHPEMRTIFLMTFLASVPTRNECLL